MNCRRCFLILATVFVCCSVANAQQKHPTSVSPLAAKNVLIKSELDTLQFPPSAAYDDSELSDSRRGLHLGVWVAKSFFRQGEPQHALFVLKNNSPSSRSLDMWLTITAQGVTHWNAAGVRIKQEQAIGSPQKSVQRLTGHTWACGRPLARVGRRGYACIRADLRGYHLSPGVYVMSWRYGKLRSNTIRFVILPQQAKKVIPPDLIGGQRYYDWMAIYTRKKGDKQVGDGVERRLTMVGGSQQYFTSMVRTLATGHSKHWYPDAYDLPTSDTHLQATAKFLKTKQGAPRVMEAQLRPTTNSRPYTLNHVNLCYSLIVLPKKGASKKKDVKRNRWPETAAARKASTGRRPIVDQKLTLRIELPEDWTKKLSFYGPGKCALVVSNEHVRDQTGAVVSRRVQTIRDLGTSGPPWQGLVRTNWMALHVPNK